MIPQRLAPLAEAVATGYGIELVDILELTGGNDPFARTFKATSDAGKPFFIKQRIGMDSGISLCAALRDAGIEAVLAPIKTLKTEIARTLQGQMILVYPYKEGHNGFERPLELEHWRQVGESLRRIHDSRLPASVVTTLAKEQFRVEGVAELEATRDRLLAGSIQSPAEKALAAAMRANQDSMAYILRRTAELGNACKNHDWDLVPCHADIHVGNIFIDSEGFLNLVDWDAPRLAPRECDLLFFCEGGIMDAHGEVEEASFFTGYGDFEPNRLALTYYQYARVLEDLVAYAREAADPESSLEDNLSAVRGFEVQFRSKILHSVPN